METEIWESENTGIRIEKFIEELAVSVKTIPKSQKDTQINKMLREILEEKRILD